MKNILLIFSIALFFSCGSSKNLRTKEKTIKGNWTLTNITYSKTGKYNVTLLGDASKNCFEGSTWKFVPNNNTGSYTINDISCISGERDFIFVVQEIDETSGYYDFLLKPKSNTNNVGFRFDLTSLTETTMQWKQKLLVDDSLFIINMNFTKQ